MVRFFEFDDNLEARCGVMTAKVTKGEVDNDGIRYFSTLEISYSYRCCNGKVVRSGVIYRSSHFLVAEATAHANMWLYDIIDALVRSGFDVTLPSAVVET